MGGVLEGVRVLDFGRYIAGPYCATLLAEFGAEVIRVEKRDGSEDRFVAPVGAGGEGALFLQVNRNKKCITLDPMKPEGQEVMRRLVATADVVVANLPPQTLRAMKLDYESLKAIKPDIILTTATAFGGPGPWSDRVGFDGVGQVMSGAVYMTGKGDPPYRAAVNWVDFGTALHCAFGTLAALIAKSVLETWDALRHGAPVPAEPVGSRTPGSTIGRRLRMMSRQRLRVMPCSQAPNGSVGRYWWRREKARRNTSCVASSASAGFLSIRRLTL